LGTIPVAFPVEHVSVLYDYCTISQHNTVLKTVLQNESLWSCLSVNMPSISQSWFCSTTMLTVHSDHGKMLPSTGNHMRHRAHGRSKLSI